MYNSPAKCEMISWLGMVSTAKGPCRLKDDSLRPNPPPILVDTPTTHCYHNC